MTRFLSLAAPFGAQCAAQAAARIAALLLLGIGAAGLAGAEEGQPISQAETLLFMTNHLKQLPMPGHLHYAFSKTGTLEKGFTDTIDIDVTAQPDGSRTGAAKFFTGEHNIPYPQVEHAEGNPVLLFYLEREIREMARLTGGKPNYFRKRIRLALAGSAKVKPVDVSYGGKTVMAEQVTITPYVDDPNGTKFERLTPKQYVFTLSDKVPGDIYQIRGLVPAAAASAKDAVIDEVITLQSSSVPN